jgi:hypothetical protein
MMMSTPSCSISLRAWRTAVSGVVSDWARRQFDLLAAGHAASLFDCHFHIANAIGATGCENAFERNQNADFDGVLRHRSRRQQETGRN